MIGKLFGGCYTSGPLSISRRVSMSHLSCKTRVLVPGRRVRCRLKQCVEW